MICGEGRDNRAGSDNRTFPQSPLLRGPHKRESFLWVTARGFREQGRSQFWEEGQEKKAVGYAPRLAPRTCSTSLSSSFPTHPHLVLSRCCAQHQSKTSLAAVTKGMFILVPETFVASIAWCVLNTQHPRFTYAPALNDWDRHEVKASSHKQVGLVHDIHYFTL